MVASLPSSYDDDLGGAACPEAIVAFMDVGQGDSTVAIDLNERSAIVIDCPSWGFASVRDFLTQHNVSHLEAVFVTHYDEDHFSGVPQLIQELAPTTLYSNPETLLPDDASLPKYRAALAAFTDFEERGSIEIEHACRDLAGRTGVIEWLILSPRPADVMRAMRLARPNRNVASMVVRLHVGAATIIIGGDAPLQAWTRIWRDRRQLMVADILRASHHGANMYAPSGVIDTATLFKLIGASHIGISVGADNRYGHPGLDTIHAARLNGARTLCTEVSPGCLGVHELSERRNVAAGRGNVALPVDYRCAGTITVETAGDKWRVTPSATVHAQRVDSWSTPHCRERCKPGHNSAVVPINCSSSPPALG